LDQKLVKTLQNKKIHKFDKFKFVDFFLRFKGSKVQRFKGSKVQRFKGSKVQRFRETEVLREITKKRKEKNPCKSPHSQ
jgi:hypothetical protein